MDVAGGVRFGGEDGDGSVELLGLEVGEDGCVVEVGLRYLLVVALVFGIDSGTAFGEEQAGVSCYR